MRPEAWLGAMVLLGILVAGLWIQSDRARLRSEAVRLGLMDSTTDKLQ